MTLRHQTYRALRLTAKARPIRSFYRQLSHRNRLPIKSVADMPVDRVFNVRVERDARFTYIGGDSDVVGAALYWGNLARWEPETWREFIPLARNARGFLDIGAFTGGFTLVACAVNTDLRCVAFEPVPNVHSRLAENVAINGWSDRALTINAAVSDSIGTSRFFLPSKELPDTGYLETSLRSSGSQTGRWVTVATTTVNASLPPEFPVDLVKIDVEDSEGAVVRGLADMLADNTPAIVIELLASGGYAEVGDVLDEIGYDYFHLTAQGCVSVKHPSPVEGDPFMNYLCVPRRRRVGGG